MTGSDLLLAVDGGNSKTDIALLEPDGTLVGLVRGPALVPSTVGPSAGVSDVLTVAAAIAAAAGRTLELPLATAVFFQAGIDLAVEQAAYLEQTERLGVARRVVVDNDVLAVLHAGVEDGWGIGLVCGTGMNCVGVRQDGVAWRYPALGEITGDQAGGHWLAGRAVWHATRAHDGRGPRTDLLRVVPAHFGVRSVAEVGELLHLQQVDGVHLARLVPAVLDCARRGDPVAGRLVDELADELAVTVLALARRLGLDAGPTPLVLGGGILSGGDDRLLGRFLGAVADGMPDARVTVLHQPPVLGAILAALRLDGAEPAVLHRVAGTVLRYSAPLG